MIDNYASQRLHRVICRHRHQQIAIDIDTYPQSHSQRFSNTEAGRVLAVLILIELVPTLIVVEATGSYETPLVAAIATSGLGVTVINPRKEHDFAKAIGVLAKTDQAMHRYSSVLHRQCVLKRVRSHLQNCQIGCIVYLPPSAHRNDHSENNRLSLRFMAEPGRFTLQPHHGKLS